ncbi:TPA: 3-dehydroquinate synthase [bacterium]|nr:3-dehydroquinate synthase [bacterium]
MKKIVVNLENRSYPIIIGFDILKDIPDYIKELGDSAFIISQPKIFSLCGNKLKDIFLKSGISCKEFLIDEGEENKSIDSWISTTKALIDFDEPVKRRTFVVAFGGGVVGDLGGFISAVYRRGINYIQIPTTLLASVDSSVGGKTGINFSGIKNIIGAFHQPSLVFSDLSLLKTLPKEEIISAMAEVVKYGVICDYEFFIFLEKNYEKIISLEPNSLFYTVEKSFTIKKTIVEEDEFEKKGIRTILNFGHTIGHSLEGLGVFKRHGEAISAGMVAEAYLGVLLGILKKEEKRRIENLLFNIGLPIKIPTCNLDNIMKVLIHDKKFIHGKTRFVIPKTIGRVEVIEGIKEDLVKESINPTCTARNREMSLNINEL